MKGENAGKVIEAAIDAGYRHIDTAQTYENEKNIGQVIQKKIDKGVVKREDLFISTKVGTLYFTAYYQFFIQFSV